MMRERANEMKEQFLTLAEALLDVWKKAHGGERATASVLEGHEKLVAFVIHDAFTPAEIRLERNIETKKLIGEYAERLIDSIKPELIACVESILGRYVSGHWMEADVGEGNLLFLFRFENGNS